MTRYAMVMTPPIDLTSGHMIMIVKAQVAVAAELYLKITGSREYMNKQTATTMRKKFCCSVQV